MVFVYWNFTCCFSSWIYLKWMLHLCVHPHVVTSILLQIFFIPYELLGITSNMHLLLRKALSSSISDSSSAPRCEQFCYTKVRFHLKKVKGAFQPLNSQKCTTVFGGAKICSYFGWSKICSRLWITKDAFTSLDGQGNILDFQWQKIISPFGCLEVHLYLWMAESSFSP